MFKRAAGLLIMVLLVVPVISSKMESSRPAVDRKAGYALLDSLSQTFYELVVSESGGLEKINQAIQKCMSEARKVKDQNQVEPVFFARYQRLLGVIKLAMAPDPDGILVPVINRELAVFVKDVLVEDFKGSGPEAIGQVTRAIRDEIINLQLYLDNLERQEKLRKAWDDKFAKAGARK